MKERLKELAEQAKLYDGWFCGKGNIEKFAELIVKESIEVMKRHDYHGEWLGEKIREHFGVEE